MIRENDEIGLRPERSLGADEVEVECIILRPTVRPTVRPTARPSVRPTARGPGPMGPMGPGPMGPMGPSPMGPVHGPGPMGPGPWGPILVKKKKFSESARLVRKSFPHPVGVFYTQRRPQISHLGQFFKNGSKNTKFAKKSPNILPHLRHPPPFLAA